jgi:hypothetical protein
MNALVRQLDEVREGPKISKSPRAWEIDRNDAAVRRLFTSEDVNSEFQLVTQVAARLGVRLAVVSAKPVPQGEIHGGDLAVVRC